MRIKIPYNRRELKDGIVVNNYGEIDTEIDTTVLAEERWEKHFPKLAENETVFSYATRINSIPRTDFNIATLVLSGIKALFCFIESKEIPDFRTFARLFDFTDTETLSKQIATLELAFSVVNTSSTVSAKN